MSEATAPTSSRGIARWYLPLAVLMSLVLLEGIVRATDPIAHFIHPHTNDYDLAMWELRERPAPQGASSAFVFGSSVAREGFDGQAISQASGVHTSNLALTSVQVRELESMQLPLTPDTTLVLVVNGLAFDDRQQSDPAMPWNRDDRMPWVVSRRNELSALLAHRARRLGRLMLGREADPITEGKARRQYRYEELGRMSEQELAKNKDAMLRKYAPDGVPHDQGNLEALETWCKRAAGGEFHMLVIWLPFHEADLDRRFADTQHKSAEVCRRHGVGFHDFSTLRMQDQDFHDHGHVLASGRARYSEELARILRGKEK